MTNHFGITNLREDMLSERILHRTNGGGALIGNAADVLFVWRSTATQKARDGTLAFFLDDSRLAPLWAHPERYAVEFKRFGVAALVQPDFSVWADDSLEEQLQSVKKKAIVSRIFQEHGLLVAPNLNWSDERSFSFCFSGIPVGIATAFTECRTASSSAEDRKAFLVGLHEAVRQVQPRTLIIYGGAPNRWWIERDLPPGDTQFVFLESWTDARAKVRKAQERAVRDRNQPNLFSGGNEQWADADLRAA